MWGKLTFVSFLYACGIRRLCQNFEQILNKVLLLKRGVVVSMTQTNF